MYFTKQEIFFLNSVTKGRYPFMVDCHVPKELTSEEIVETTIQSLIRKEVLDSNRRLTEKGKAILLCWKEYRNSRKHILMNQLRIAVLPDKNLVTVYLKDEGYEIDYIGSEVLMYALMNQSEYLRLEEEKTERGKWQSIHDEQWSKLEEKADGIIPMNVYEYGKLQEQKVFYWIGAQGYVLNLERKRIRTLSVGVMRRQIYRQFVWEEQDSAR